MKKKHATPLKDSVLAKAREECAKALKNADRFDEALGWKAAEDSDDWVISEAALRGGVELNGRRVMDGFIVVGCFICQGRFFVPLGYKDSYGHVCILNAITVIAHRPMWERITNRHGTSRLEDSRSIRNQVFRAAMAVKSAIESRKARREQDGYFTLLERVKYPQLGGLNE